jgi:dienelactone hydrolase
MRKSWLCVSKQRHVLALLLTVQTSRFPGVVLFSEIYQVTGPVARFARQIAGHGYIVAAPSSYHEFVGPEPLTYDVPGTDLGNELKVKKV